LIRINRCVHECTDKRTIDVMVSFQEPDGAFFYILFYILRGAKVAP